MFYFSCWFLKIVHNPSSAWRNWRLEIEAYKKIQPASSGTIVWDYVVDDEVVYIDNWRTAFSQSIHKTQTLVSECFWFCLWYVWQNRAWNYLWHIFPGWNINSQEGQIIDHRVEKILAYKENILQILTNWRDDGLSIEDIGIFGGRIWQEGAGKWYLEALGLLGRFARETFWEEPKVIWLPTRGMNYRDSSLGENPQTLIVGEKEISIHKEGAVLEHPITIRDVSEKVEQILS